MRSGEREPCLAVVQRCRNPAHGRVALLAGLRKSGGLVVWIGRAVVVVDVARDAGCAQTGKYATRMAIGTGLRGVSAHQGEQRLGMVEHRACPSGRVVADGTILRESGVHVVGIGGFLVVGQMARSARRRSAGVLSVDVALRARDAQVESGERELGQAVVHGRLIPTRGGVALFAVLRHAGGSVVRVLRSVVIVEVTRGAGRAQPGVGPTRMARGAGLSYVHAGQGESREGVVIELGPCPAIGAVALRAGLREPRLRMVRVVGGREVLPVATEAVRLGALEIAGGVTGRAIQSRMCPAEGEVRYCGMIELCPRPTVHAVAGLAGGREVGGPVVGQRCARVIGGVATETIGRQSSELPGGRALVTIVAGDHGVRAQQWKAVLMLLLCPYLLPAFHRVAALTLRPELPAVHVGVTVGTARARIREHQLGVTLPAIYALVTATQRIGRGIVIKFQVRAEWRPTGERVTVLARCCQLPVRAPRDLARWCPRSE